MSNWQHCQQADEKLVGTKIKMIAQQFNANAIAVKPLIVFGSIVPPDHTGYQGNTNGFNLSG